MSTFTLPSPTEISGINFGFVNDTPRLFLSKGSNTGTWMTGEPGIYTLRVTNSGQASSTGSIEIKDTLPSSIMANN